MANVKISQLPVLGSVTGTDTLPIVNGTTTFQVAASQLVANVNAVAVNGLLPATAATANTLVQRGNTGNIAGNFFIGDGSQLTNLPSGNTSNVLANVITLNTTAGISVTPGQIAWDNSDGTANIGMGYGNVVLQVGQETVYVVRNETGVTISDGTAVYCSGVTPSGRISISPMIGDGSISPIEFLGLATQDIATGVNGVVTWFGYIRGLDTRGTANTAISVGDETWAVGDKLYVHPTAAGKLTNVEPEAPNVKICVASIITRNQTSGQLFVRPTTNLSMVDLSDVQITTPSSNQILSYDSNRWQNVDFDISVDTTPTLGGDLAGGGFDISNIGNIIPSGNATQSLGSNTNQWSDLWVSNATIYLNSIPLSVSGNGVLQFDGNDIVTSGAGVVNTGNIDTTGNIAGTFFIGDGSQLTNLPGSTGDITFVNTTISAPNEDPITIEALNSTGLLSSSIVLDPDTPALTLTQVSGTDSTTFAQIDGAFATGTYTTGPDGGSVVLTGANDVIAEFDTLQGLGAVQLTVQINGAGPVIPIIGTGQGGGTITFDVATPPGTDPTTVTELRLGWRYESTLSIDYDDEAMRLEANAMDLELRSNGPDHEISISSDADLSATANGQFRFSNFSTSAPIIIETDANNTGRQWQFRPDASLALAPRFLGGSGGESAQLLGTRTIIGGFNGSSYAYSVALTPGAAALAYTSSPGVVSTRITFAIQSSGVDAQWEQFDVVATASNQVPGEVNFVVSNRVKATTVVDDALVTAAVVSGAIQISLTVAATQTAAYTTYSAVEFGIMLD